jgi:hypothetical protein
MKHRRLRKSFSLYFSTLWLHYRRNDESSNLSHDCGTTSTLACRLGRIRNHNGRLGEKYDSVAGFPANERLSTLGGCVERNPCHVPDGSSENTRSECLRCVFCEMVAKFLRLNCRLYVRFTVCEDVDARMLLLRSFCRRHNEFTPRNRTAPGRAVEAGAVTMNADSISATLNARYWQSGRIQQK